MTKRLPVITAVKLDYAYEATAFGHWTTDNIGLWSWEKGNMWDVLHIHLSFLPVQFPNSDPGKWYPKRKQQSYQVEETAGLGTARICAEGYRKEGCCVEKLQRSSGRSLWLNIKLCKCRSITANSYRELKSWMEITEVTHYCDRMEFWPTRVETDDCKPRHSAETLERPHLGIG